MCAAGIAAMRCLLQAKFLPFVAANGQYLSTRLQMLSERHNLKGERGSGLLRALELHGNQGVEIARQTSMQNPTGLLLNAPRPHLLRFMPALNVTEAEIDLMIDILDSQLRSERN